MRERPLGPQELAALGGLGNCAIEKRCEFPVDPMLATFQAALIQLIERVRFSGGLTSAI